MRTCNILLIAVVQVVFCRVREPLTIQTSKLGNLVSTTDSLKTTIKSTESHSSKAGNNQHQPSGGKSAPCESGSNFEEYLSEHVEHFAKWYEKSKHNNSGNKTKERPKSTKNTTTAKAKNTRRLLRRTVSPPTSPKINPKILYSFTNSNTYIKILVKFHFCTSVHSRDERRSTADAIINELNAAFKSSAFLFMSDGGDIGWGSSDVDPKLFENALKNSETSYELKHTVRTSEYARKELGKVNPTLLHVYIVNKWHNEDSTTTLGRSTFPQPLSKNGEINIESMTAHVHNDGVLLAKGFEIENVVHEVGHWLGLFHPFKDECSIPNDFIFDTAPQKQIIINEDDCKAGKMPANSFCTDESVHQMMDSSYYRGWGKTFEIIKQRAINSPTTPNHFNYMSDYNSGSGCKKELTAGQLLRASSMFYSTRLAVLKTLQNKLSVDELLDWSMGDIDTSDRAKHWVNS